MSDCSMLSSVSALPSLTSVEGRHSFIADELILAPTQAIGTAAIRAATVIARNMS